MSYKQPCSASREESPPAPTDLNSLSANAGTRLPPMDPITEPLLDHPLVAQALAMLDTRLPEGLFYHDIEHTVSVITKAVQFSRYARLPERDTELIAIAAAWHDTGYCGQRHNNEPLGAAWAAEAMQESGGYSQSEIDEVTQAILDTQMKPRSSDGILHQVATGRLSPWLLDADLANFGSRNFLPVSLRLLREVEGWNVQTEQDLLSPTVGTFFGGSSQLLTAHRWQTEAARELLQSQKENNQQNLIALLHALRTEDTKALSSVWGAMLPYPDEPHRLIRNER